MMKLSNVSFTAVLHCTGHCSLLLHFMGHTSTATNMLWPTMCAQESTVLKHC